MFWRVFVHVLAKFRRIEKKKKNTCFVSDLVYTTHNLIPLVICDTCWSLQPNLDNFSLNQVSYTILNFLFDFGAWSDRKVACPNQKRTILPARTLISGSIKMLAITWSFIFHFNINSKINFQFTISNFFFQQIPPPLSYIRLIIEISHPPSYSLKKKRRLPPTKKSI